jgi:arylsulfatase
LRRESLVQTPNLDRLAQQGLRFTSACVTTPICGVSRASIFTGQWMSRHGTTGFKAFTTPWAETYPGLLRRNGYFVGHIGKWHNGKFPAANFDFGRAYHGKHWMTNADGTKIHVTQKNENDALEFLRTRPKGKPFCLTLAFFAPHAEDDNPQQFSPQPASLKLYRDVAIPVPTNATVESFNRLPEFIATEKNEGRARWRWRFDTPEKYQAMLKNYYRLVTEVDATCGRVLEELKAQGQLDHTLVIFIGDNGYYHGEHGLADKWYPHQESIRVPLIVHDPRINAGKSGRTNDDFVLNVDVAPTILAAAGIAAPPGMQGSNFAPLYLARHQRPAGARNSLRNTPPSGAPTSSRRPPRLSARTGNIFIGRTSSGSSFSISLPIRTRSTIWSMIPRKRIAWLKCASVSPNSRPPRSRRFFQSIMASIAWNSLMRVFPGVPNISISGFDDLQCRGISVCCSDSSGLASACGHHQCRPPASCLWTLGRWRLETSNSLRPPTLQLKSRFTSVRHSPTDASTEKPSGSVRYAAINAWLNGKPIVIAPAADARNTEQQTDKHPPAILTPPEWGVVLPFRWVEIEGWSGSFSPEQITRRAAFASTWDDAAANFKCSDEMLNRIWELCRYSIKATTFAGVYVDGDRERIPYEADAYLNQISHYYTDRDTQMARDTFDHLMQHGTWPSEWSPHMVLMAYADWMADRRYELARDALRGFEGEVAHGACRRRWLGAQRRETY